MQEIQILLQTSPLLLISIVFILSLFMGSFLNVVIYRLPIMLERKWTKECNEYLQITPTPVNPINKATATFNLIFPLSQCCNCHTPIKFYQNIPIISYLFLGGKCHTCKTHISIRYPLIEIFTAIISAVVAWNFGYNVAMFFSCVLTWSLIALSFIDIDYQLLPDAIISPVLWCGLFLSLFSVYTDTASSIIGAIAGYLSFWTIFHLFKIFTAKEGMGYGDFKLCALLGAWLGWQYIPIIIIFSSIIGAVIGILRITFTKINYNTPTPFGHYLAIAGWLALMWGKPINEFLFPINL